MLSEANTKAADAELSSRHVHQGFNLFRPIPCIVNDFPKHDFISTMQIGKVDNLQKWIIHWIKTHEWLNKYNAIWLSVPTYHDLIPNTKSYKEDSQWNGQEMKEVSRYLLGVVTQSLQGGSPTQRPILNHKSESTWAVLELYIYARYTSHNDATLSYIEVALRRFDTFENVFLLWRHGKEAKAKANALRTALLKTRKVEEQPTEAA
jgi:hypothetical protein